MLAIAIGCTKVNIGLNADTTELTQDKSITN